MHKYKVNRNQFTTMSAARFIVIIVTCLFVQNEAARILVVVPTPSFSHQVVFRPLVLELVKRGHELVMLTTDPIFKKGQGPTNLTEIDVHDMSYQTWRDEFVLASVTKGSKHDLNEQLSVMYNILSKVQEKQFRSHEMQTLLDDKSQKFDLLILESFYCSLLGLSIRYNIPVILMSSLGTFFDLSRLVGAPVHPLVYPTFVQQRVHNYSFFEKIHELNQYHQAEKAFDDYEIKANELSKRLFGANTPPLSELKNKVDLVFINVHPLWELNRPVPPNVIHLGGLHQKPEKELPQDLKYYLDSSKHGVIYISFGTNVEPSLLPSAKIQIFIKVFSKLPYDVLWKWNQDELPGKSENIKISKWLPQSDLLRHPKIKLFITQGGLQSTDEAITAGVPLVGIPMLGDQWFNVEQYEYHKIGIGVDMDTITDEKLETAIQTILNNKSYRENTLRLRSIMRDQPQTPLERATWWTEYVLRHGGAKHLRSPAANMPWTEFVELKLISYLFFSLITVTAILVFALYYVYNLFFKHRLNIKLKNN